MRCLARHFQRHVPGHADAPPIFPNERCLFKMLWAEVRSAIDTIGDAHATLAYEISPILSESHEQFLGVRLPGERGPLGSLNVKMAEGVGTEVRWSRGRGWTGRCPAVSPILRAMQGDAGERQRWDRSAQRLAGSAVRFYFASPGQNQDI